MNKTVQIIIAFFFLGQSIGLAQGKYKNIAIDVGINHTYGLGLPSGGVSAADFTGDGLDDITLTSDAGNGISFYENSGSRFTLLSITLPNTDGEAKQILWADIDNDGDKDLYITFLDMENRLFRNDGNLTFTDITSTSGLFRDILPTYGAAWADYDRDGFLDLYFTDRRTGEYNQNMSNHLYRNKGDGTFEETTIFANVSDSTKAPFCAYFLDYNNDGWPDIYVAQDKKRVNTLFKNNGNGTFADVSQETYTNLAMDAMSVTVGDYDVNGFLDIYVTNIPDGNKLLRNDGFGYFTEVANNSGTASFNVGWGAQFMDVDNDIDLDLYVSGSRIGVDIPPTSLFISNGNGVFNRTFITGDTATSFANAVGDFNNDGFLDIIVNNPSPYNTFLWSNQNTANNWLKVDLEGVLSNRDAIGARLEVYINGTRYIQEKQCGTGFLGQNSSQNHFGLGLATKADSLVIKWPSGHIEKYYDVLANTIQMYKEGDGAAYAPAISRSGSVILCDGDSLVLDAGLYGRALNYLWSDGSTESTLNVKTSGKYAVSVTSSNLGILYESDSVDVQVLSELIPQVEITTTNVSCYGNQNGSISLNINGSGNYTVSWSDGSLGTDLTNIDAGIYNYTITSNSGCSLSGVVSVSEPDSLGVIIEQVEFTEGSRVHVIASGGNWPYSYSWSHSQETTPEVFITENGTYSVEVTDANNCSKTTAVVVDNDLITGIDNEGSSNNISVYPNPTNGALKIRWQQGETSVSMLVIRSISGREVRKIVVGDGSNSIGVSLQGIPPGIYFITMGLKNGEKDVRKVQIY